MFVFVNSFAIIGLQLQYRSRWQYVSLGSAYITEVLFIKIRDGETGFVISLLCGSGKLNATSVSNKLEIRFASDDKYVAKGFQLKYQGEFSLISFINKDSAYSVITYR